MMSCIARVFSITDSERGWRITPRTISPANCQPLFLIYGAIDPDQPMVPFPPTSGRLDRGLDRACAVGHGRCGQQRQPVHRHEASLREDRNRHRLAARPHSAAHAKSRFRADLDRRGRDSGRHNRRRLQRYALRPLFVMRLPRYRVHRCPAPFMSLRAIRSATID